MTGGHTTLVWSAVPSRTYRVEYKDSANDSGWSELPGPVTAESGTATFTDAEAAAGGSRFYRVRIVE